MGKNLLTDLSNVKVTPEMAAIKNDALNYLESAKANIKAANDAMKASLSGDEKAKAECVINANKAFTAATEDASNYAAQAEKYLLLGFKQAENPLLEVVKMHSFNIPRVTAKVTEGGTIYKYEETNNKGEAFTKMFDLKAAFDEFGLIGILSDTYKLFQCISILTARKLQYDERDIEAAYTSDFCRKILAEEKSALADKSGKTANPLSMSSLKTRVDALYQSAFKGALNVGKLDITALVTYLEIGGNKMDKHGDIKELAPAKKLQAILTAWHKSYANAKFTFRVVKAEKYSAAPAEKQEEPAEKSTEKSAEKAIKASAGKKSATKAAKTAAEKKSARKAATKKSAETAAK